MTNIEGFLDFCKFRSGHALEGFGILYKVLIVQPKQEKLTINRAGCFQANYLLTYFSALSRVLDISRLNCPPGFAF